MSEASERTTHRGVAWRRHPDGSLEFFDAGGDRWVAWAPDVDAPPLPPAWGSTRVRRAGWASHWRVVPVVITVVAVAIAVAQVYHSSGNQSAKETAAAEAMVGKCLAQHGSFQGHPKYSSTPVDCGSTQASVKVVEVVPTTPGSPPCPAGTTPVILALYSGVKHPHLECLQPVQR